MKINAKKTILGLSSILIILLGVLVVQAYIELSGPGVIVLLYHRVSTGGGGKYVLSPAKFEQQMKFLKTHGYKTTLARDIVLKHTRVNPAKTVILTFDDGTEDHYTTVFPILQKYGFNGVFFIITKYIGAPGNLTASQIKEMSLSGMEIGSHTYSHPFLDELTDDQIRFQLKKSRDDLQNIIECPVTSLAPPGGWFDERTVEISRELGYKAVFGCEIGVNDLSKSPLVYRRIEIPGNADLAEFGKLLTPSMLITCKIEQIVKTWLHDLIGSNDYHKLAKAL